MSVSRSRLVSVLCVLAAAAAYPDISGSCNGVFSGDHLPNEVSGDGGFKIILGQISTNATHKRMTVDVQGLLDAEGILVKAWDPVSGKQMKSSAFEGPNWGALQPGIGHFDTCPVTAAAVTHIQVVHYGSQKHPLQLTFGWPKDKDVSFVAWMVIEETVWYEVTATTAQSAVGSLPLHCPASWMSIAPIVVAFAPVAILVLCGMLLKCMPGSGLDALLNHTVPLGATELPKDYYTENYRSPWYWVRLCTFDVLTGTFELSVGEMLSSVVFYGCQIASIALITLSINDAASSVTFSQDEGRIAPNPFDAPVGRAMGRNLQYAFSMVLLLPTRKAVWPALIGVSFERCIKYHRMVARWTMFVMTLHFVLLLGVYGAGDLFTTREACHGSMGNLWGTLSFALMCVLMFCALEPIRRRLYELFYYTHFLWLGVVAFGCMHSLEMWYYVAPPAALWFIDRAVRLFDWGGTSKVQYAAALPGDVAKLVIKCPKIANAIERLGTKAIGSYVYLKCTDVSGNPIDFHPFSISGFPGSGDSGVQEMPQVFTVSNEATQRPAPAASQVTVGLYPQPVQAWGSNPAGGAGCEPEPVHLSMLPTVAEAQVVDVAEFLAGDTTHVAADEITLHIKKMGENTWSSALLEAVKSKGQGVRVSLEGPYGYMGVSLGHYSTVICVAGGIGVTPMAPLLAMALDKTKRQQHLPNLKSVWLIWTVQRGEHVEWFKALLAQCAQATGEVEFRIRVHVTRDTPPEGTVPCYKGRPNMREVMTEAQQGGGSANSTAVLACGPAPMVKEAMSVGRASGMHCHFETFLL